MKPPRALVAAAVLALGALVAPDARASNLWLAWEPTPSLATCRPVIEDMLACALGATQLASLATAYPHGRALTVAGSAVVRGCFRAGTTLPDFACAIREAGFDFRDGDVIEYLTPTGPGLAYGENYPLVVDLGGRTVHASWAWVTLPDLGGSCDLSLETALHEAYEASSDVYAADCCIGESPSQCPSCSPTCSAAYADAGAARSNPPLVCPSGTFASQRLSPTTDEFTPASCTSLVVDAAALCAQPRAVREAGRCTADGNLATCGLGAAVRSCGGAGCTDTPAAHCNAPLAGYCTLEYAHETYAGLAEPVVVTCVNDGAAAWPGGLALVTAPDADSPLWGSDATWTTARQPGAFGPDAVPPGGRATLGFTMHAPAVDAPTTIAQGLALRAPDGSIVPFPIAGELAMSVLVLPCAADPIADAGAPPDDASWVDAGGGCALGYASARCGGGNVTIAGVCRNTGTTPWPDRLYVVPELPDASAPFDPEHAIPVSSALRGACVDVRQFTLGYTIPFLIGDAVLAPRWAFVTDDGGRSDALPSFGATLDVAASCPGPDAGRDAGSHPPRDGGADASHADARASVDAALDEGAHRGAGCTCRASGRGHHGAGAGVFAWLALAAAGSRRTRRRA